MFELVLRAPEALVEPVSQALMDELDALSVSVEDADADGPGERALFGEPGMPAPAAAWDRSTLRALFETEAAADRAAALLLAHDWGAGPRPALQALHELPDTDWVRLTQAQFAPVEVTPAFWIVPSWHEPPPQARRVIRLDPGLAFGTGTHPTTRMCLRWIAAQGARPGNAAPAGPAPAQPGPAAGAGLAGANNKDGFWHPRQLRGWGPRPTGRATLRRHPIHRNALRARATAPLASGLRKTARNDRVGRDPCQAARTSPRKRPISASNR